MEEHLRTNTVSLSRATARRWGARMVAVERTGDSTLAFHRPSPEESTVWMVPELSPK